MYLLLNAHGKCLPVPKDRLSEADLLPTLLTFNSIFTQKESQYYQGMSHGKDADYNENLWQVRSLLTEWKIGQSCLMLFPLLIFLCFGSEQFPSPSKWAAPCPFPPSFSNVHNSPMVVQAAQEPHAAAGIAHVTSTGQQGLGNSSW